MQSRLNLRATYSLPLCLSGISQSQSHPLPLSTEMADHDRRRQDLKRQRSVARDQETGTHTNFETEFVNIKGEADGDLFHTHLGVTAKAA